MKNEAKPVAMLHSLEERCTSCDGRGWYWEEDRHEQRACARCGGAGYEPTELGEQILSLMRHNLKPMLRAVAEE